MSTRDLGSVTSYAMAVALGFEGTEAEWVTYMMEAGDNAASAAASAASASASATSAEASAEIARVKYGSPLVASTVSAMTELNRVYVYTGSETGYTAGNWYYFNGTTWVSGGVYNGEGINTDTTLSVSGMAADAKKVGDELADVREDLQAIIAGGGSGITKAQWDMMIELFRCTVYDSSILPNPKSVIDALEDSIENIPSTGLSLSTQSVSATSTDVITVTASLTPSNSTDSIYATSSDSSVCTVNVNNKTISITPVGDGTATITVTTDSGISKTISVSCDLPTLYSITNNLTGCSSSNSATQISEGSAYNATLTVDDETYSFVSATITMGGVEVTGTAFSSGTISIPNVTGNIVITVVAEQKVPEYGIVFPASFVPTYQQFFKDSSKRTYQFDTLVLDIKIASQSGSKVIIKGLSSAAAWLGISNGSAWNNGYGDSVTPAWNDMTWGERANVNFAINIAQAASPVSAGTLGWGSGNSMNPAMTLYGIKCLSNGDVVVDYKAQSDFSFKDTISGTVITPDVTTGLTIEEVE